MPYIANDYLFIFITSWAQRFALWEWGITGAMPP